MRYEGRAHEMDLVHGYRIVLAQCKCGWFGSRFETLDEALIEYGAHARESRVK